MAFNAEAVALCTARLTSSASDEQPAANTPPLASSFSMKP